jgi:hypothetical protein
VPASPGVRQIYRHDQQPCDLSILRTNRQIHREVLDTLYGTVTYVMKMRHADVVFLGRLMLPTVHQLPPTIRLVNSLRLCIRLERHTRYASSAPFTRMLVQSLLSGPYKLHDLRIELKASSHDFTRIFGRFGCKLNILHLDLACNLGPLRALRGVTMTFHESLITEGTVSFCSSMWGRQLGEPCPEFDQQSFAIKANITAFMDSLAQEIAQPA